jgi:hypothetical protein
MGAPVASKSAAARAKRVKEADPAVIDALWLGVLARIGGLAAHEVKGALNGVSVNVEVVRTRAEKPGVAASAVGEYATAAAEQLSAVISMSEALLWLVREPRGSVAIGTVVDHIEALLAPAVRADGRRLETDESLNQLGATSAEVNAVRLAIGGCLLAAVETSIHTRCVAEEDPGGPAIRIESRDGATLATDKRLVDAVANAGVRITAEPSAIFIRFPRQEESK